MAAKAITNIPRRLTPQEIMNMPSLKNFTEEKASELLHIIESFCEIAYGIWQRQEVREKMLHDKEII